MLEIIAFICLIGALVILYFLSAIDLREGLLPNELVAALAALGMVFNISTLYLYTNFVEMALGAFIGGGILYLIRGIANTIYKDDALGLGDVKLLTAAGLWLGPELVLVAMTLGAFAGFMHGIGIALRTRIKSKVSMDIKNLSLPAGPGFALGIVMAGVFKFWSFPVQFLHDFSPW